MPGTILFTLLGYFSGSILYANVFGTLFGIRLLYQNSPDQNPGTANAYQYGGFWCGTLTLLGDILKGFLPVFLYLRFVPDADEWGILPVLVAPVIGHIFPVFTGFRGGKGIATTFGCLSGLFPYCLPVILFAAVFLFLSVGLRITPHYYRTIFAYLFTSLAMVLAKVVPMIRIGFLVITAAVCLRMHLSKEEKERFQVKLLWIH